MSEFQLIEADEAILVKNIMVVLYGEPNTTKTSLSFTTENPILLDFDEGVHRSIGRKLVVKFKHWPEVQKFLDSGIIQERGIKTLVVDTGGVMLDEFIAIHAMNENPQNKKKGGGISQTGFGTVKDIYAKFQTDCRKLGLDVVIICHASDLSDGDLVKKRPKMTGGSYDILKQKADLMGYMEIQNNVPILTFSPTDRNVGKNSPNFPVFKIPHFSEPAFKTFLGDLIQQAKDHLNSLSEEQRAAVQKVEDINLQISDASDLTDLADIETAMESLSRPLQVQILKNYNEKYSILWVAKFVNDKKTPDEFNSLIDLANNLSKDLQSFVKPKVVANAITKGLYLTKEKKFDKDPNFKEPAPTVTEPKAEEKQPEAKEEKPAGEVKQMNLQV